VLVAAAAADVASRIDVLKTQSWSPTSQCWPLRVTDHCWLTGTGVQWRPLTDQSQRQRYVCRPITTLGGVTSSMMRMKRCLRYSLNASACL